MSRRNYRIAMIPGDGIGAEVIPVAGRVLQALGLIIDFEWLDAGWDAFARHGTALPEATVEICRQCDGALFGAVSSPSERVEGYSSPIIEIRRQLDLYGNLRPAYSMPVPGSQPRIDILVVRENTEGLYIKQESIDEAAGRAVAERVITRFASARIARLAFEQAQLRASIGTRQPLVTIVHKANVLSVTDGLFRETCLDVAGEFPEVDVEEQLVDSMAYRMVRDPQRYDVIVAPNLYGDILSDIAAALVGGLGIAPSANVNDHFVIAEPVHGSAPDIAGKGIANPYAAILSAALLLHHLGEVANADAIVSAVHRVMRRGILTPDLGGAHTMNDVVDSVLESLQL